jgi:hypothetical protein
MQRYIRSAEYVWYCVAVLQLEKTDKYIKHDYFYMYIYVLVKENLFYLLGQRLI